ncbi:ComEA family DNA-binding protein [Nitrosomonas sp. Nm34]|uniref:ComEA family DNA-binding protein n=1 Tax=Nitrosomonas sp. Nm34 TaxID=1881055 RepID=UPI0034A1527C
MSKAKQHFFIILGVIMVRLKQLIIIFFILSSDVYAAVDINTASQAELEALKGIGPAKAKAIVEYRNEHGLFSSIDDLEKVNGIGAGTLQQIRSDLTVDKGEKIAVEQKEEPNP